jgi:hypothetical protein
MDPVPTELALEISEIRLVDTHEHLGLEPDLNPLDPALWSRRAICEADRSWITHGAVDVLQDLFSGGYVRADLLVAGATAEAVTRVSDPSAGDIESRFAGIRDAWEAMQHTGFGEAVRLVANDVYGVEALTPENLERAQAKLEQLRAPGAMLHLLSETARLDHVQIDHLRCACSPDPSGPEFFLYDLSWWKFCNGEIELDAILRDTGIEVRSIEDLREAFASIFQRFAPCAVAVKAQHAYNRTLRWEERSDDDAARSLAVLLRGQALDESSRLVLGDWCWARGVELAIEHNLPFKLHTGLYGGTGTMPVERISAGNLCSILARYPAARFVLMHMAYPYSDELVAIAKHYPNVWVDLCWAWSVDPYSGGDFVRRFLHAVPINKLFAFGGDAMSPTRAVAFAAQARRWLTRALEAEVSSGDISQRQAITIAHRVMRDNQYACFDLEGTRAAVRAQLQGQAAAT